MSGSTVITYFSPLVIKYLFAPEKVNVIRLDEAPTVDTAMASETANGVPVGLPFEPYVPVCA